MSMCVALLHSTPALNTPLRRHACCGQLADQETLYDRFDLDNTGRYDMLAPGLWAADSEQRAATITTAGSCGA